MGISFNDNNFAENLRGTMSKQVNVAMNSIASNLQNKIDAFCNHYLGRPFEDVRLALIQQAPNFEIKWENDSEIDQWARSISDGQRITHQVPEVDL